MPEATRITLPIQTRPGTSANLPDVNGIGFCADGVSYFFTPDSAIMHSPGMVMSFVSVRLVLIDPVRQAIVARTGGAVTRLMPLSGPDRIDHFEAMSGERKVEALRRLITAALERLTPNVVSASATR